MKTRTGGRAVDRSFTWNLLYMLRQSVSFSRLFVYTILSWNIPSIYIDMLTKNILHSLPRQFCQPFPKVHQIGLDVDFVTWLWLYLCTYELLSNNLTIVWIGKYTFVQHSWGTNNITIIWCWWLQEWATQLETYTHLFARYIYKYVGQTSHS